MVEPLIQVISLWTNQRVRFGVPAKFGTAVGEPILVQGMRWLPVLWDSAEVPAFMPLDEVRFAHNRRQGERRRAKDRRLNA